MITRRSFMLASAGALVVSGPALAHRREFRLAPELEPQRVRYEGGYKPGTLVVDTGARFLYLVEGGGFATRYGVGVGRAGLAWKGTAVVGRKAKWPSWRPTDNMIRTEPELYSQFAGGLSGGLDNPLGSRALYLYEGGRDTYYRIHGTQDTRKIGRRSSSGCIGLYNPQIEEVYDRAPVGTQVKLI